MSTGRIRRLNEPSPEPKTEIHSVVKSQGVTQSQEPQKVEVTIHEEVIREGEGKVRAPGESDGIEIRVRHAKNPEAWDKAKRGGS